MNTKYSTATLPEARPLIPFVARISAQVIAEIRSSIQQQAPQAGAQMAGLVLGEATERLVSIAALQPFQPGEPLEEALERWTARAHSGPFDVVGWYAVRSANSAELLDGEIAFHERHFPKPTDVAVLFGGGHTQEILTTVYARSPEALFAVEDRRWGSVRLHARNSEGPALVSIGRPVTPDFYLRVFEVTKSLEKAERAEERLALMPRTLAPWICQTAKGIVLDRVARRLLIAFAVTFFLGGIAGVRMTHSSAPASSPEAHPEAVVIAPQTVPNRAETVKTVPNPVAIASPLPDFAASDLNVSRRKPPASQTYLKPARLSSGAEKAKPSNTGRAAPRPFTASFVEHTPVAAPTIQQPAMAPPALETSAIAAPLEQALPSLAVTAAVPSPIRPPSTTTAPANSSHGSLAAAPSEGEARDYTPPQLLKPSTPHAPAAALRSLTAPAAIQVEVNIDKSGRVTKARALNAGKTDGELVNAALDAAREWIFQPATHHGKAVSSRHAMVFQFQSPRATP